MATQIVQKTEVKVKLEIKVSSDLNEEEKNTLADDLKQSFLENLRENNAIEGSVITVTVTFELGFRIHNSVFESFQHFQSKIENLN